VDSSKATYIRALHGCCNRQARSAPATAVLPLGRMSTAVVMQERAASSPQRATALPGSNVLTAAIRSRMGKGLIRQ